MNSEQVQRSIENMTAWPTANLSTKNHEIFKEYVDAHTEEIRKWVLDKLHSKMTVALDKEQQEIKDKRTWLKENS